MDEITATEIRKWAWMELAGWTMRSDDDCKPLTMEKRIKSAEILAVWAMSGLPAIAD